MRPSLPLRSSILVALALAALPLAGSSNAAPAVLARWGQTIVCDPGPLAATIPPGGFNYLTIWVERPADVLWGLEFEVVVGDPAGGVLADAWRFDAGGCQPDGSIVLEDHYLVDPVNRCPYLGYPWPHVITRSIVHDPATSRLHAKLRATFGIDWQPDPTKSYRVGRAVFDHARSVDGAAGEGECGGVERGVCLAISAGWIDAAGVAHPWPVTTPFLTANGAGFTCDTVPARASTWGTIKAQYRN